VGGVMVNCSLHNYQFVQLDSFFDESLFGVQFDYNQDVSADQALTLKTDLVTKTSFENTTDPDPDRDNVLTLIGHEAYGFKTALIALEKVKRTQDFPIIGAIEWETEIPFVKYLHHFSLPTGEEIVSSQDFLGVALKINGSKYNPEHYQLGYANIPPDFITFLLEGSDDKSPFQGNQKRGIGNNPFNLSVASTIIIEKVGTNFKVDVTYSNLTFLFQTNNIDLDQISELEISKNFFIAQFDHVTFSILVKKYSHHEVSGVETISEVSLGKVINLLINEELPLEQSWSTAEEYSISANYKELFEINEILSFYSGPDIKKRLELFNEISFSIITAQNVGILNGTNSIENIQTTIDGRNLTKYELNQFNYPIQNEYSILYNEKPLLVNVIKERDFVVQENEETNQFSLVPIKINSIALNQQIGFAENILFLQETSLLRDLVAECAKRFIDNPSITSLSTDKFFKIGGLYLTAAQCIQDYQLVEWEGFQFTINLLQYITKTSSDTSPRTTRTNLITEISIYPGVFALLILLSILRLKKPKKNN
jgi:hypothetical protein